MYVKCEAYDDTLHSLYGAGAYSWCVSKKNQQKYIPSIDHLCDLYFWRKIPLEKSQQKSHSETKWILDERSERYSSFPEKLMCSVTSRLHLYTATACLGYIYYC